MAFGSGSRSGAPARGASRGAAHALSSHLARLVKRRYHRGVSSYSIGEAKTQLSKLVHLVEDGKEVVLRRGRQPVVRLVAIGPGEGGVRRKPGRMRGRITVPEDFDEWPPDVARALGALG